MKLDLSELSASKQALKSGQRYRLDFDENVLPGRVYGTFVRWDPQGPWAIFDVGRFWAASEVWQPIEMVEAYNWDTELSVCQGQPFGSVREAVFWQLSKNAEYPFWIYPCQFCSKYHVCDFGLPDWLRDEIMHTIRTEGSKLIGAISRKKQIHRIKHRLGVLTVVYSRDRRSIEIIDPNYDIEELVRRK